jgi:hypothetical protein
MSSPLRATLKLCHPERSLAKSEANRQTQSKDPAFARAIGGDARRSHFSAWTMSILIAFLLLLPVASFSQTARRFPGKKSELTSPDGRWTLQDVHADQKAHHSILLKNNTTGKTRKLSDYERSVGVVWSPDSRHFALNDYAGSDFTETTILSVNETVPNIDVQKEVNRKRKVTMGGDHEYFGVAYWVDEHRVVIHHWGYGNGDPIYCECYVYTLNGSVRNCTRQPNSSDIDSCERTTP